MKFSFIIILFVALNACKDPTNSALFIQKISKEDKRALLANDSIFRANLSDSLIKNHNHPITYNQLCALHYKWLVDKNSVNQLKVDLDGVHLLRQDLMDIVDHYELGLQLVIFCDQLPPKTLRLAYRGIDSLNHELVGTSPFLMATDSFYVYTYQQNPDLLDVEKELEKKYLSKRSDPSTTITWGQIEARAVDFISIKGDSLGTKRPINRSITNVILRDELKYFLNQKGTNDGVVCFFGFDETSNVNWVRLTMANVMNVPGNTAQTMLSWHNNHSQHFLERTFP